MTIRAYKLHKNEDCMYEGYKSVYNSPFKTVYDDEVHRFIRGEKVDICTDTAKKLLSSPYKDYFMTTGNPDDNKIKNNRSSDSSDYC